MDKLFLDNFAFSRLRTSSEDFGLLRESLEMIVSSAKIPALPGKKSHAYNSEKVGRYRLCDYDYYAINYAIFSGLIYIVLPGFKRKKTL